MNSKRLWHLQERAASKEECQNLIRIHMGCSSVGYMPELTITTLEDLCRCGAESEFLFIVSIRERIREIAETVFDLFGELYFEWCSITCWHKGSTLKKHYDSNRSYLKHRHISAILYLNSPNGNIPFEGGNLVFEEACSIQPEEGRLVLFSSGEENEHYVQEILSGRRFALTLWFTKDWSKSLTEVRTLISRKRNFESLWETQKQRHKIEKSLLNEAGLSLLANYEASEFSCQKKITLGTANSDSLDKDYYKSFLTVKGHTVRPNQFLSFKQPIQLREILMFSAFYKWKHSTSIGVDLENLKIEHKIQSTWISWKNFRETLTSKLKTQLDSWKQENEYLAGPLDTPVESFLTTELLSRN